MCVCVCQLSKLSRQSCSHGSLWEPRQHTRTFAVSTSTHEIPRISVGFIVKESTFSDCGKVFEYLEWPLKRGTIAPTEETGREDGRIQRTQKREDERKEEKRWRKGRKISRTITHLRRLETRERKREGHVHPFIGPSISPLEDSTPMSKK